LVAWNSIPNIGCHYFWPGLKALPKSTPTYLVGSLILKLEVAWVGSWFGLMYFCVVVVVVVVVTRAGFA
jgi:hypothetical protein